ncbi:type I 3-dehydroquinate dehydratase [Brevibacterium oceani]|uniref:type I 3-dehydroquinate dehydratase n=1 Tax=Brevibacterium oceani TaxID=358099 RepID=UPI0015E67FD3|nr:type I 3-dehydroquinate dehydratase [Brevibacterium oceani]
MLPLPFLNPAAGTPAVRNPLRPSLIVPTQAVDADDLSSHCAEAARTGVVDVVEWRIDPLLAGSDADGATRAEAVLALLPHAVAAGLPVLVTLRTGFEGGLVDIAEDEYAEVVRHLIAGLSGTVPIALDIEIDRAESHALIAAAREVGIPVVASHHNFESTDSEEDLLATFRRMAEAGADVAKAAMMPRSPVDVARLLAATAEAQEELGCPVLGISMGQLGRASRIMGADFGSCATFAQIGEASAPGQIDAAHLAEILDRI